MDTLFHPRVLNKYKDPLNPATDVYIGRPSKWGNPFPLEKGGDREEVYRKYCEWLDSNEDLKRQARAELKGKNLICYCAPKLCHGDKLIQVANEEEPTKPSGRPFILIPQIPFDDGITHINMYSKGKTELGRQLSHFAPSSFTHPTHGPFASVEAYWYWASTGKQHEQLRALYGYKAKEAGKVLPKVKNDNFIREIEEAVRCKITQNPGLLQQFKTSVLPLTHYYVYGEGTMAKMVPHWSTPWFEYYYNNLRDELCGYSNGTKYKVIVAGSRVITDYALVVEAINRSLFGISEIVCGKAKGVDTLGERFAKERFIPIKYFPADWDNLGKRAGIVRNHAMGDYADCLIAIWDGKSVGTEDMINYMRNKGKPVYILRTDTGAVPDGL